MLLPRFDYMRPSTLEEALRLLSDHGHEARLVAGGTELFPRMKYRLVRPGLLIGLKNIQKSGLPLSRDNGLIVDATTTLSALHRSEDAKRYAPLLSEAAAHVASQEIRNMGTLGGNLCQDCRCLYYNQSHLFQFESPCLKRGGEICYSVPGGKKCLAVHMSDTAPALLCLDAVAEISGPSGERSISLVDFYSRRAEEPFNIKHDEILTRIRVPFREGRSAWAFRKFSPRGGMEFATLSVAVLLWMEDDGMTCRSARVAAGSVSPAPQRASRAESCLEGREISDRLIEEAADSAAGGIRLNPHHGFSITYLKELMRVEILRALKDAVKKNAMH